MKTVHFFSSMKELQTKMCVFATWQNVERLNGGENFCKALYIILCASQTM